MLTRPLNLFPLSPCHLAHVSPTLLRKLHQVPHPKDIVAVVIDQMLEGGLGARGYIGILALVFG